MKKNCFCDPKVLLALVLFLLQFNNNKCFGPRLECEDEDDECIRPRQGNQLIDNSILFVIALCFICKCFDSKSCGC